jgi:hypothetical protein
VSQQIKDKIPDLLKQVKELKFETQGDFLHAKLISESIFDVFRKLRIRAQKKISRNKIYSESIKAAEEAEEEIVFGIISLFIEKMMAFIFEDIER